MSALAARIAKLESRAPSSNPFARMTDEQLERVVREFLIDATPEQLEAVLAEHPEFRELFAELAP